MNYIKSLFVVVVLLALTTISGYLLYQCILYGRQNILSRARILTTCIVCSLSVVLVVQFGEYIYPLNREIKPELIAIVEVDPEDSPCGINGSIEWHAVYEEYGLYAESRSWRHCWYANKYSDIWPVMDMQRYTYIITYCQEIESLSYNVWETIDVPIFTGAKKGYMILRDKVIPTNIYIYRIPKMRIDNDEF